MYFTTDVYPNNTHQFVTRERVGVGGRGQERGRGDKEGGRGVGRLEGKGREGEGEKYREGGKGNPLHFDIIMYPQFVTLYRLTMCQRMPPFYKTAN